MTRVVWFLCVLFTLVSGGVAFSASRATASLSSNATRVGDAVTLEIEIEGEDRVGRPVVTLEDFDVVPAGQSQQTFITPGRVRNSATYSYQITPRREGNLTVPAIEVKIGNATVTTQPLALKVGPPEGPKVIAELGFGEVTISKPSVWVGEWVTARVDFYLNEESANWNPQNIGELKSDACLSLGFKQVEPQVVERAGKQYRRWSWTTVLVPSKAGKVDIGPVSMRTLIQRANDKSPNYDPGSIFRGRRAGPVKEMTLVAPAVELDVKPLPVADRPATFDGAIGKFTFSGSGSPDRVKVGEPVQMSLTVTGEGNFDRLSDPPLLDKKGWQAYPGQKNFKSADDSSLRGIMSFAIQVVPSENKDTMPVFEFCYFDPDVGKYITLRNSPDPLIVEGDSLAANGASEPSAPEQRKAPADILPCKTSLGTLGMGFRPYPSPFQFAGLLLGPIPIIAGYLIWKRRRENPARALKAQRRREIADLRAKLNGATSWADLFECAVRMLQLEALDDGRGIDGMSIPMDADWVIRRRKLDSETEEAIRAMFAERAEIVYAGGSEERGGKLERERVCDVVNSYFKASRP